MPKLKKLLKKAVAITPLPFPDQTPAKNPLTRPIQLVHEYIHAIRTQDAEAIGRLFVQGRLISSASSGYGGPVAIRS